MNTQKNIALATIGIITVIVTGHALGQLQITGAGATFPYPLYSKWFHEYRKVDPEVQFNYQSIGSGGGQRQLLARTVDFGASDAPMSDELLAEAKDKILHIPTVGGAVAIAYNLPGKPQLNLDPETLADIFLGKITKWDHQRIKQLNPDVTLPSMDLVVVHRSDGSGTTFIFTDYLSVVNKEWAEKVGRGTSVKWPTGLGAKGNEGVTGQIKNTPGAIGYIELAYAKQNNLPVARLKNSAGKFVVPSADTVTAALATINVPDDFRFSVVNAPGEDAYPIAGATWILVYQKQTDPRKGRKLVEFLRWGLTDGQKFATELDYAPLPENLRTRVLKSIDTITY